MTYPKMDEKHHSQLPALRVLQAMGYQYIDIDTARQYRGENMSNVILDDVLLENLHHLNRYTAHGKQHTFSDGSLKNVVDKLKYIGDANFIAEAKDKYELLRLGTSETVLTDGKAKTIRYIDWRNWDNNQFHMTAEYTVRRTGSNTSYRPDIVLFVNGIPFVIIECKSASVDIGEAISQHMRNQQPDGIRHLYKYAQILIVTKNTKHEKNGEYPCQYATTGTPKKYWSVWHEQHIHESDILNIFNTPCNAHAFYDLGTHSFTTKPLSSLTEQDKTLVALCRPDRLLKLSADGILFDADKKKIARYQQYFAVQKIMHRIQTQTDPKKRGGVIWHTQGSGKSLTMIMTAEKIASCKSLRSPRIIVVTDRTDLDEQITETFMHCGYDEDTIHRCTSGRDLAGKIQQKRTRVLTTLVQKFETVIKYGKCVDTDDNIFIMIDEAHRTQYGVLSAQMHRTFPNATYLGFTGTPLMKGDKNTYNKFGTIIDKYAIDQAVQDNAIVPLLYEGRHAITKVHNSIDIWFDRITKNLQPEQVADLKRKYGKLNAIHDSIPVIQMRVYDIHQHFTSQIQPLGYKGQIVVQSRETAVKFQQEFEAFNDIKTQVVMTLADKKHHQTDVHDVQDSPIAMFHNRMLDIYGDEKTYAKQVTKQFKDGDLDIVIVVDKLLTGFDVPANSVMYLCKELKGHTLLQAIARVNRLYDDNKIHGLIIDYVGILGDLKHSLDTYTAFQDFDEADIANAVVAVHTQVNKLESYYHALINRFTHITDTHDTEQYIDVIRDAHIRNTFYEDVQNFTRTLELALSTVEFYDTHTDTQIKHYKTTTQFYQNLKKDAKSRFHECFDMHRYKGEIQRLLNKNLISNEVAIVIEPINILNTHQVNKVLHDMGVSTTSKADTIAFATDKIISEKMAEDPEFFKKFSKILQDCIQAFQKHRDAEKYLEDIMDIRNKVTENRHEDLPDGIEPNTFEAKIYGNVWKKFDYIDTDTTLKAIKDMTHFIRPYTHKVDFNKNTDAQNKLRQDILLYIYDEIETPYNITLSDEDLTKIQDILINLARNNKVV